MAGGSGTRLWPISRKAAPKQFSTFLGQETLFQKALGRVSDRNIFAAPIIITNNDYRFLVSEQARQCGVELGAVLLEPVARNTAPAIAAAAAYSESRYPDAVLFVLASDHEMEAGDVFQGAVEAAASKAAEGAIVTFGIHPTQAATGYGYIKAADSEAKISAVESFVEKPDRETAQRYLADGSYLWNSGMFMMAAKTLRYELDSHAGGIWDGAAEAVAQADHDLDYVRLDLKAFANCPDISIDYAVMEKTSKAQVVRFQGAWSDLGSWNAIWKESDRSADGNVTIGSVTLQDCQNTLAYSHSSHLALQGLDDAVVVASEDAVFVGSLSASEKVGEIAKALAAAPKTQTLAHEHPTSYRPWGGFTNILFGDQFKVKKLFVSPQKQLSLQSHQHRSEHWVIVKGAADITLGDDVLHLRENESVYIPVGTKHRLSNASDTVLEVIEVQTGSYLEEDDIERFEDDFGRKEP